MEAVVDGRRVIPSIMSLFLSSAKETGLLPGSYRGVERQPLKKLAPDENGLLKLVERWRAEAEKAWHKIDRIAVVFEAGRDGFWLALLAKSTRYRGPRHSRRERGGFSGAPARQD